MNHSSSSAASYFCQGPDELYDRLGSLVNSEEGLLQQWCGTSDSNGEDVNEDDGNNPLPVHATKKKKKKKHSLQDAPGHYLEAVQHQFLNSKHCSSLLDDDNDGDDDEYDDDDGMLHENLSMDGSIGSHTKFKIVSSGRGAEGGGSHPASTGETTRRRSSLPNSMIPTSADISTENDATGNIPSNIDSEEPPRPEVMPLHLQNVILKEDLMEELQPYLPFSKKGESFWMLYSMTRDGASLDLLLNKVQDAETTILAIETLDGEVFGAFCTQAWKRSHDYFGSGQSFLWRKNTQTTTPGGANPSEVDAQPSSRQRVQVFSFAYNNYNIQLLTQQNLIVGGSGGISEYATEYVLKRSHDTTMMDSSSTSIHSTSSSHNNTNRMSDDYGFGLWVGHDLLQGSSSPCSTFCSPSLSVAHADGSAFEIVNIEIWALTPCINLEQAKSAMDNKRFLAGHMNAMTKVSWMHSPSIQKSHQRRRSTNDGGQGGGVGTVRDGYYDEEDEDEEPVALFGTSTTVPLGAAVIPSTSSKEEIGISPSV
jgi:TLD